IEYFDKKSAKFTHYNKESISDLKSNKTWTICEDSNGLLYIGHVDAGLSVLSKDRKHIKNYSHNPTDDNSIPSNWVKKIFIDSYQRVWIGTTDGLALFNPIDESFISFKNNKNNTKSILSNSVFCITQIDDFLYIGVEQGGVSKLDLRTDFSKTGSNIEFNNTPFNDYDRGLFNLSIRDIFTDSFGNKWFATYGGGIYFEGHTPTFFHNWTYSSNIFQKNRLSNPITLSLCVDSTNRVWAGTDGGGVNIFENDDRLVVYNSDNNRLNNNTVLSTICSSDGNVWIGTYKGGVSLYNNKRNRLEPITINGCYDVRCFFEESQERLWIGSSEGLFLYNTRNQNSDHFTQNNSEIPNNLVRSIVKDHQGNLWVSFFGAGIAVFDNKMDIITKFNSYNGFPSNTIEHLYCDELGYIWAATSNGLVWFNTNDPSSGEYQTFNKDIDCHVMAIIEDDNKGIWFSSNNGIYRLIRSQMELYHYDELFGIPRGKFMSGSVTKDKDGIIYFGSQNGICHFNPKSIPTEITLPKTTISEFIVLGNHQNLYDTYIIPQKKIELNHNQNTFSISFNVLDYSFSQLAEFSYSLQGFENKWYDTKGNNIIFRNVPPGIYVLHLKSRVRGQIWSDQTKELEIIIRPPFWLSWWAKTLYTIIILLIVSAIVYFYKRKLYLENAIILEKQNSMREQSFNNERLRFFTNITHELRTSLTLIIGPLEDLNSDSNLAEPYSYKIGLIYRSAERLRNLINQILEFRKTETQNKKLSIKLADIVPLVSEISLKYKELNRNDLVTLITDIPKTPIVMYYDHEVITTIIENILTNAFKYTQQGEIIISTRLICNDESRKVEISISDTGNGIPQEAISMIFNSYYQVNNQNNTGTGIGLALVKSLVSLHNGTIQATSEIGKGSKFTILFDPDYDYPNAIKIKDERSELKTEDLLPINTDNSKPIILIVEDNDDIREYIYNSLSEHFIVYTAENGKAGLEEALSHIPDIIVSDVMMPIMDGFELCKIVKEDLRTSHIPFVILSAKDSLHDKTIGYNLG
ncbi:MAG: two-component regulator propeller domain-containing protein, partial [Bacteroidales bacterium]